MNVCTCPDETTLHGYLIGSLEPSEDSAIEEHLEACAACQSALDRLDTDANGVFACLREPVEAPTVDEALGGLMRRAKALAGSTERDAGARKPPTPDLPFALGNYTLLELLGTGGMGQVFKAEHRPMKRIVALKLLSPHLVRSPAAQARFRREISAMARLSSPYIVTAFDGGEAVGCQYLAMEYVPGQSLADRVRQSGPLSIDRALDCLIQAARGLEHAHEAGIIHRDVKPSNLLLHSDGAADRVKLLDLGLAGLRDEGEVHDLTGNDAPMGTTHFMAPEQAANPHDVDARADIYGLGCTLFYLLTGRPPYEGSTAMQILLAHRDKPIPSLHAARPDCPPALDALFHRLVAKRPEDRPASMRAVIAELERIRRDPQARPMGPVRKSGQRVATIAAAVAASIALTFGVWLFVSGGTPSKNKPAKSGAIEMARIPAGEFWMGASESDAQAQKDEMPRRKIKIKLPFLMGKTEVTQAQYEEVMGVNPSAFGPKGRYAKMVAGKDTGSFPVESVTWFDAIRFCIRLSEKEKLQPYYKIDGEKVTIAGGNGYRLPTEAEWEYACRAGTDTMWSFGEKATQLGEHAWFADNSDDTPHPVGQKKPNPFGLYDMYGNVPEWCWDRYEARYYDVVGATDPVSASDNPFRVFRGGAWNSLATQLRTSARSPLGSTYGAPGSNHLIGFRVVRNVEE